MKPKEWSVKKAALLGALVGPPFVLFRDVIEDLPMPLSLAEWTVYFVGGAASGMFLFALVAVARNFFVRRYR